jgi:hypothetical protein
LGSTAAPLKLASVLLLLFRCPNKDACNHTKEYLASISPLNRSVTPQMDWSMYEHELCSEGYTGLLCGSCTSGYGQTDPFSCSKCAGDSKGRSARLRIVWTLVGIVAGLAVFVQWAVNESIQENRSYLSRDQPQHIQVTDVIKALIMYIQVGQMTGSPRCI